MLVLSRSIGEKVVIGDDVTVTVLSVDRGKVRLGFTAPKSVKILREELTPWEDVRQEVASVPQL